MERRVLTTIGRKLGLTDQNVIRKAEEYMRLADIRSSCSSLAVLKANGACRAAMCLELAAADCTSNISREAAVQVSGMTKKTYNKSMKAMECLLDIQATSIFDMATKFGATTAKPLALQILKRYEENSKSEEFATYSKSLFHSAALYTACRHQKVKVEKKKFVDAAGVTRTIFDRQVALFTKEAENMTEEQSKKKSKRSRGFLEVLENMPEQPCGPSKQAKIEGIEPDDYEEWRERTLTLAHKALGLPPP